MNNRHWFPFCALAWSLCFAAQRASAHDIVKTVTFKAAADTSLFELTPDNNLGGSDTLVAGTIAQLTKSRALIRFAPDFSLIPADASIVGVSLQLSVVSTPGGGGANSNFELHRMLRPWNEGTQIGKTGSPAQAGEPTWNARSFPAGSWSRPGGAAGTDFEAKASSSAAVTGLGRYEWSSNDQMKLDLAAWQADPSRNYGWILLSDAEATSQSARRFGSRDSGADAPTLVVEYVLPPEQVEIDEIQLIEDFALLHLDLAKDIRYAVQFKDDLSPGTPWQTKEVLGPFTEATHWVFADPRSNQKQRFYQLQTLP